MSPIRTWLAALLLAMLGIGPAWAQTSALQAKGEEKPKTYWEEHTLFGYIGNSATFNLSVAGDITSQGLPPRGKGMDTFYISLDYSFF